MVTALTVAAGTLRTADPATSAEADNAPKAECVVIRYDTDFENRSGAVEAITPSKEANGRWRVAGYFIR